MFVLCPFLSVYNPFILLLSNHVKHKLFCPCPLTPRITWWALVPVCDLLMEPNASQACLWFTPHSPYHPRGFRPALWQFCMFTPNSDYATYPHYPKAGIFIKVIKVNPKNRSGKDDFISMKWKCLKVPSILISIWNVCVFIFESEMERQRACMWAREVQREKRENPKQVPCCQRRAWCGAWTHKPWDDDLSRNQESDLTDWVTQVALIRIFNWLGKKMVPVCAKNCMRLENFY